MKIAVRYHSRSGNTKKVALAVAEATGVQALDMTHPLPEKTDVVFLCSAMYAAGVDEPVKQFIADNHALIGRLCNICTTAIAPSNRKAVQKIAAEHGVTLTAAEFRCPGSFAFLHRGRPDERDLQAAKAFASSVLQQAE